MKRTAICMAALLTVCVVAAVAQDETSELTGKAYLSGGDIYEGIIEVAEWGVVDGGGIGTDRAPTNEYMSVEVAGELVKVPVEDIAVIEATWEQIGSEGATKWQVDSLTITRKDGSTVRGKPHWFLHETTLRVQQADGTLARATALPLASAEFDPGELLVKVELGEVSAAPTEPDTTPTEPDTTPAEPDTTPTEPDTTPTEPDTTPTEPDTTPTEPDTGPVQPAAVGAPSTITLTVVCPKCGETMTVTVAVSANTGE